MNSRIKQLRKKLSLSQTEFSDKLGASHASVCAWERGANIPESRILQICAAFGVNEAWLRTGDGEMLCKRSDPIAADRRLGEYSDEEVAVEACRRIYERLPKELQELTDTIIDALAEHRGIDSVSEIIEKHNRP